MLQLKLSTAICAALEAARRGRRGKRMQEEELKHTDILREAWHCRKEQILCCIMQEYRPTLLLEEKIGEHQLMFPL